MQPILVALALVALSLNPARADLSSGAVVTGGAVSSGGSSKLFSTVGLPLAGASGRVLGTAIGNRPPTFSELADQSLTADSNFSLSLAATDLDGDAVSYSVTGQPSGASLNGATFTWTPDSNQTGNHSATFAATDAWGGIATQLVNFTVNSAVVSTPDPTPSEPSGPVVLPPQLTVVTDTLDFGAVVVGQSQILSLQVASQDTSNFTSAPFAFTGVQSPRFSAVTDRLTVPAGNQGTVEIAFAPTDENPLAVVVALDYGATFLEVVLVGRGLLPGPRLELVTPAVDFGLGRVESATTKAFTLTNTGTDTLHVSELAANATRFQALPAAFAVAPGDSQRVEINFWRPESGIIADALEVHSDAIAGTSTLALAGESWFPEIELGAEEIRFDDVHFTRLVSTGGRLVKILQIINRGFVELQLPSLSVGGPSFAVDPVETSVPAGDTLAVMVSYTPKEGGMHADTLLIRSDDPERGALKVALAGATLGSVGPQLAVANRFGLTQETSRHLVIANEGNFELQVHSLSIDNPSFSVDRDTLFIAAGASDSLRIFFAGDGEAQGVLTIRSDDPLEPTRRVVLLSGTVDELPAGPVVLDFNSVSGDQGQRSLGGVASGSTYDIQLVAEEAPAINGWGVLIEYDPQQLAYVSRSFQHGAFLPNLLELIVEEPGRLNIGGTALDAEAVAAGDGVLGGLSFEVLKDFSGRTELAVTEVSWRRADGEDEILLVHFAATLTSRPVVQQGDFDGNGRIDFTDFFLFADSFGSTDPVYDLNNSGRIDFLDFFLFADFFDGSARAKLIDLARYYLGLQPTLSLHANFPNPFNQHTLITYEIPQTASARLEIYNALGQRVRTLVDDVLPPGKHQVQWNGRDQQGRPLSTGIYWSRLQVDPQMRVRKMLLLQ